ncbi:MAG: flagellar accessory protein FlaH [Nitrospiraceae bacterium]|nr:flagellar accessory protein FlaH [Nitrospiraceae bacterium]
MAEEELLEGDEERILDDIISSGNYEIDQKMGGGLPRDSLVLFEGPNDSGKSVLAQQIVWGALHQGHRIAVFTTENTTKSLLKQMASLALDIDDYFIIGHVKIFPVHVEGVDWSEDTDENLLHFMLNSMKNCKEDIIVIDSLTVFVVHSTEDDILNFFTGCKKLCDHGKTILLTAHGYAFSENLLVRIRSICDTHLHLKIEEAGDQLMKVLEVAKIRGAQKSTGNIISFDVDPGFGLRIIPIMKAKA